MAKAKEEQAEQERIRLREAPIFDLQFAVFLCTFRFALYPGDIDLGTRTGKGHALSWLRESKLMLHPVLFRLRKDALWTNVALSKWLAVTSMAARQDKGALRWCFV